MRSLLKPILFGIAGAAVGNLTGRAIGDVNPKESTEPAGCVNTVGAAVVHLDDAVTVCPVEEPSTRMNNDGPPPLPKEVVVWGVTGLFGALGAVLPYVSSGSKNPV